MIRRLAALIAALCMVFMLAVPALANDLHQSPPIASDTASFQGGGSDCDGADLEPGQVLWHFVHTDAKSDSLPSTLTATFTNAGTMTVDGFVNGNSIVMYNIVTGPDTLLSASDTIDNDGNLNLSHICNGGPPPEVPEAPAAALLLLSGLVGLGFVAWRMRRNQAVA